MPVENQYPIGEFEYVEAFSESLRANCLAGIQFLPNTLEAAIAHLDEEQLQTPYRKGGWSVHQLVHHIADSHINGYCRFKCALTEKEPIIKTYNEKLWAETDDVKNLPVNISITLLFALHSRWYEAIRYLHNDDWMRVIRHPDYEHPINCWYYLQLYSWHGRHHVAQIWGLREKMKWK